MQKSVVNSEVNYHMDISRDGKIHAIIDGLGNSLYFQLSAGNIYDSSMAVEVLSRVNIADSTILAGKAYGNNDIYLALEYNYDISPKYNPWIPWHCWYEIIVE